MVSSSGKLYVMAEHGNMYIKGNPGVWLVDPKKISTSGMMTIAV